MAEKTGTNTIGRWSEQEHEHFVNGLASFGKDWKRIAETIPTRTVVQIRTHAQKYFQKLDKMKYSLGEEVVETSLRSPSSRKNKSTSRSVKATIAAAPPAPRAVRSTRRPSRQPSTSRRGSLKKTKSEPLSIKFNRHRSSSAPSAPMFSPPPPPSTAPSSVAALLDPSSLVLLGLPQADSRFDEPVFGTGEDWIEELHASALLVDPIVPKKPSTSPKTTNRRSFSEYESPTGVKDDLSLRPTWPAFPPNLSSKRRRMSDASSLLSVEEEELDVQFLDTPAAPAAHNRARSGSVRALDHFGLSLALTEHNSSGAPSPAPPSPPFVPPIIDTDFVVAASPSNSSSSLPTSSASDETMTASLQSSPLMPDVEHFLSSLPSACIPPPSKTFNPDEFLF